MRISDSMIASSIRARLQTASERLFRLQEQVASGLAFSKPSQNPSGSVRAAALRSSIAEISRYRANADEVAGLLRLSEVALASISTHLRSAREAGLAMTEVSEEGNIALADQVAEIASQVVREINSASQGRYLFAGFRVLSAPVVANPAGPPPYLYEGDQGEMLFQLGRGITVKGNLNGAEVLNFDQVADPGRDDALETLRKLEAGLRASDHDAVGDALASLDRHLGRVVALRAELGARMQHVELAEVQLDDAKLTFRDLLSEVQDVDLTQAIVDLRSQEIAYQAAAAAASALQRAALLPYFR